MIQFLVAKADGAIGFMPGSLKYLPVGWIVKVDLQRIKWIDLKGSSAGRSGFARTAAAGDAGKSGYGRTPKELSSYD
jgi:hypothetical protein